MSRGRLLSFLLTAAGCGVPIGVLLWLTCTHDLHLNVYSGGDDEVWYREYFPTYFNVIVTASLSLFFGLIVAAVIWIAPYVTRTSVQDSGQSVSRPDQQQTDEV